MEKQWCYYPFDKLYQLREIRDTFAPRFLSSTTSSKNRSFSERSSFCVRKTTAAFSHQWRTWRQQRLKVVLLVTKFGVSIRFYQQSPGSFRFVLFEYACHYHKQWILQVFDCLNVWNRIFYVIFFEISALLSVFLYSFLWHFLLKQMTGNSFLWFVRLKRHYTR